MNKVEQFIKEQNKIILEDREKTLIALGLTEKEYAPDSDKDIISTWAYPKYEFIDGKEKYYREVAIQVTDEEYALILSKVKQVEEIKTKFLKNQPNEEENMPNNIIKKWIPVFKKTEGSKGWSKTAKYIRISYYVLFALSVIISFIITISSEIVIIPYVILGGFIPTIFVEGLAGILDYLAELTSIARNGFKYNETTK